MPKHLFRVEMPCEGCSKIVTKLILKKNDKLRVEPNLKTDTVIIDGDITIEEIEDALRKWAEASKREVKYISTF